ncbi:MAG: flavin reductase family protein [Gemmatimonadota bacterium]
MSRSTPTGGTHLPVGELTGRQRYHLLSSLVVPRPIGWISTCGLDGHLNLAPFSYFGALCATPMLVGVSIGHRSDGPKDSLKNIQETGIFCVNVVTRRDMEAMNLTAGEFARGDDEFQLAGLTPQAGQWVNAPYVNSAAAALECTVSQEVLLEGGSSTLVIGRVEGIHLAPRLEWDSERYLVDPHSLDPVGRLGGADYSLQGDVVALARPVVSAADPRCSIPKPGTPHDSPSGP